MMPDVSLLEVALHGRKVGTLALLGGSRTVFTFDRSYVADDNRDTLSLSFKNRVGGLITDQRPTDNRAPPFFANLLPEGPLREYLARNADIDPRREFFLLWALGKDLPGALAIKPVDGETWPPAGDGDPGGSPRQARGKALRFSLAGVQLKFSAIQRAGRGLTIPAEGVGGSWIVKLPSPRFKGVPENEFSMMSLARMTGLDVPDVALHALADIEGLPQDLGDLEQTVFAVKRFDRTPSGPVHAEDFAQVFGVYPEDKYRRASYRNIAEVLRIETGEDGIAEFIRRLVFNTLIGNADMHLKNWSLTYPNGRRASLSPGYDFVSTVPYIRDDQMALKYARSKRFDNLTEDELAYLAAKARLSERLVLKVARDTVERFHAAWKGESRHLPLTKSIREAVESHMKSVPLSRWFPAI